MAVVAAPPELPLGRRLGAIDGQTSGCRGSCDLWRGPCRRQAGDSRRADTFITRRYHSPGTLPVTSCRRRQCGVDCGSAPGENRNSPFLSRSCAPVPGVGRKRARYVSPRMSRLRFGYGPSRSLMPLHLRSNAQRSALVRALSSKLWPIPLQSARTDSESPGQQTRSTQTFTKDKVARLFGHSTPPIQPFRSPRRPAASIRTDQAPADARDISLREAAGRRVRPWAPIPARARQPVDRQISANPLRGTRRGWRRLAYGRGLSGLGGVRPRPGVSTVRSGSSKSRRTTCRTSTSRLDVSASARTCPHPRRVSTPGAANMKPG